MTRLEPLNNIRRLPLTVDDFLLLDSNGAFEGYGKTELIAGEIYFMNAQHRPHIMAKMDLHNALHAALSLMTSPYRSVVEGTVAVSEHDAPEPDIILTSEPYGEGPIPLKSVGLIIEVSDTTQRNDFDRKLRAYAEAMVPEYWVFDIKAGILHQMWLPEGDTYRESREFSAGSTIASKTISGLAIQLPA
jgi:Uma2 family endonuclease